MTHADLVLHLAQTRAEAGELVMYELSLAMFGSGGYVDVAAVKASWTRRARPTFYEVKVSRSDLLADLRSEKWRRYLPFCERFYFAAPKGIATKADIPAEVGLVLYGAKGWYTVKTPRIARMEPEAELQFWRALAIALSPASFKRVRPMRADQVQTEKARRILERSLRDRNGWNEANAPLLWLARQAAHQIARDAETLASLSK